MTMQEAFDQFSEALLAFWDTLLDALWALLDRWITWRNL
jgi:hypothetical protein